MKFEMNHKIGEQKVNVTFKADIVTLRLINIEKLKETFQRLGGVMLNDYSIDFPLYINSEIIEEVIHNTCFVCGGLMQDGEAIQEGKMYVHSYDSAVDTYEGTIEYPDSQTSQVIKVRKCSSCGHSHT